MLIKIILAIVITLLFYLRRNMGFKLKIFFHPILLAPALGLFLGSLGFGPGIMGGISTGVTIGVITELLWGSNLVDFNAGLEYGLLASLLTVALMILTHNINLFLILSVVLVLMYSFQESLGYFANKDWFIYLILGFNLFVLFSMPLFENILGWVPAGILSNMSIAGGLIPAVALGFIFVQGIFPIFKRDNIWYYSYLLATIIISVLLLHNYYWASLFFPLFWYSIYYLWNQSKKVELKKYFRISIAVLVVIITPLIVNFDSSYVTSQIQYVLWAESIVALFAVLRFLKLTPIEGYFIMLLLGIIGAKLGLFI